MPIVAAMSLAVIGTPFMWSVSRISPNRTALLNAFRFNLVFSFQYDVNTVSTKRNFVKLQKTHCRMASSEKTWGFFRSAEIFNECVPVNAKQKTSGLCRYAQGFLSFGALTEGRFGVVGGGSIFRAPV